MDSIQGLLNFLTDNDRIESISKNSFWDYVQNTLNNPSDIWSNTFYNQSDEYIRNIVLLVVFNDNSISEELLKSSYIKMIEERNLQNPGYTSIEFRNVIKNCC